MRNFRVGDCVLVIDAACEPGLIGHVGTVARAAAPVAGIDRFGRVAAGVYVVVDLPEDVNRHGTTLWYLKPEHLIKLAPPDTLEITEAWRDESRPTATGAGSDVVCRAGFIRP